MAISFPSSPVLNQTYTVGSKTWIWNGYAWDLQIANNTSVLAFAQAAFDKANNALANTGSLVTSNTSTQYIIGNTTPSTSNVTGALVVSGGVGINGNVFLSSANTYNATQSSRLGWVDNYFFRSPQYNGVVFNGSYLSINSPLFYIEPATSAVIRSSLQNDSGNRRVLINSVSGLNVANTTPSTSNTTGAIIVSGGVGVKGNVYADAVYAGNLDVLGKTVEANTLVVKASSGVALTLGNSASYTLTTGTRSFLEVYVDGYKLVKGIDYNETSTTSITPLISIPVGSTIEYRIGK